MKKLALCFFIQKTNQFFEKNSTLISMEFLYSVTYTKYLGVVIVEKLNWHEHVNYVCMSLMKFFGIFSKIKHFMNKILLEIFILP